MTAIEIIFLVIVIFSIVLIVYNFIQPSNNSINANNNVKTADKVNDKVKILAGKDKGKEGKVLAVNVKDNTVIVENVNMVTKHSKPSAANQNGGIITKESPLHISNVMLMVDGKATRVGFKMDGDKKVRVAKATGAVID